jgi:pimeloyl-ACP methyl ester carboxylesterase
MPYNQRLRAPLHTPADLDAPWDAAEPSPRAADDAEARARALPPALDAERFELNGLNCYVGGSGPALLLVHGVHPTASAADLRPLFERYAVRRTVFAPDLPGFGLSERGDRAYTPRLMTDALHALAGQIALRCGGVPIDTLALGLGCEFVARAATEAPRRLGRLAFVDPSGLTTTRPLRGPAGSTLGVPALHAVLAAPLWSDALFRGLTRPMVLRHRLQRGWGGAAVDDALWRYHLTSARAPGAKYAPLHHLAGDLNSADIHRIYEALVQPVWVSLGLRGGHTDLRGLAMVRKNWHLSVYHSGAMPYFEQADAFCADFDAFLDGAAQPNGR